MEDLLSEKDVAVKLRVSLAALRRWRLERRGPRFVKIGRLVRYREEDLALFVSQCAAGAGQVR